MNEANCEKIKNNRIWTQRNNLNYAMLKILG